MSTDYSGMTLNERLYEAKLMAEYDLVVKKRDRKKILEILKQVSLEGEEAIYIVNTVLNDPQKYGH